jgi:hypothetical protein
MHRSITRLRSLAPWSRRHGDERGEGVISAAIAVLVMAFLGVIMWVAFSSTFNKATSTVDSKVDCVGQAAPASGC